MKKVNLTPGAMAWLAAIVLIPAWVLFNWEALQSLHQRWLRFDEPYAVGYPAVALSVWWICRHWRALQQCRLAPSLFALAALCIVLLIGAAAQLVQLMLLQQLAAVVALWLMLVALLGWAAGRFFIFPFALLSIGIPFWDFLVNPMRVMTVWFTQHMLDLLRIPAHVDGFMIGLPAGFIEVAGGCSGLNLFLAMALVGLLFAESRHIPRARRVAIVLLAVGVGIFENWLRVFALVLIAHFSELRSSLVQHHGSFGWWIYAIGLLPYFGFATKVAGDGRHIVTAAQVDASLTAKSFSSTQWLPRIAAMGILLLGLAELTDHLSGRRGGAEYGFIAPDGAGSAKADSIWLPRYTGQDVTQVWRVQRGDREYEVAALTYVEQSKNKKLIYYANRIADEHGVRGTGQFEVAPGFSVNSTVVRDKVWREVWWFWWVDGSVATGAMQTKLLQLRAMLRGDPSAALIAVTTLCPEVGCQSSQLQAESGLLQLLNELRQIQLVRR